MDTGIVQDGNESESGQLDNETDKVVPVESKLQRIKSSLVRITGTGANPRSDLVNVPYPRPQEMTPV